MKKEKYKNEVKQGNAHWQIDVSASVFAPGKPNDPAGAFLAMPGKLRPQPHKKINECDH